jgi:pseudaminic acid cytidylyltransferase
MKIAVIPARGGSKRIPRKNIKEFCGKPMIAWPIEVAKASKLFDHIIVSTDDAEIAQVSKEWGAETPFMRPIELADDYTATRPVVNHAIREIEKRYGLPDYVCCIYPCAAFVQASELIKAFDILTQDDCQFVFTAGSFPSPIQRAFKLNQSGRPEMFYPEFRQSRSQELEEAFHDAGQFYLGKTQAFLDDTPTYSQASIPLILPRYRVHDIDTQEDWDYAEIVFNAFSSMPK